MFDLTQLQIELIVSLTIGVISLMTNAAAALKISDTLVSRFFVITSLLAICSLSYHAYLQSSDKVFAGIAVVAILLMLFLFVALIRDRR